MSYPDPSVRYRRLTSGDVGRIVEVGELVASAAGSLDHAATGVDDSMSTVLGRWRGDAAEEFLDRARATNQAVAATNELLGRIERTVRGAAVAYGYARRAAGLVYQPWRDRPADLDETAVARLATRVDHALTSVADGYARALGATLGALAGSDERPGGPLVALKELLLNPDADGPVIPHTLATGDADGEWVPQGLAYDADRDQLLLSYYSGRSHTDSLLSVLDENSGEEVTNVRLGGVPTPFFGLETAPPNHSGGVAVDGDDVWVTSTEGDSSYVYHYSRADIEAAAAGETVEASGKFEVGASAYATFAEGKLWVGSFEEGRPGTLYGYDVGSGATVPDTPSEAYQTPDRAQGVVVRDGELIFSQSLGRDNTSSLVTQDRDNPFGHLFTTSRPLPNMAEGIAEVDGDILALYESGAEEYADGSWPRDRLTRTPIEDVTGDGGFHVEPSALSDAAGPLDHAADAVADSAARLSRTQLVAAVLGDVPAAKPFSTTVTACIEACGTNLSTGARSIRATADGLVDSAETYRRLEDSALNLFGLR